MDITEQRALYPWETPQYGCQPQYSCQQQYNYSAQPRGCEQPLEDAVAFPAQPAIPEPPAYVMARALQGSQVTLMWGESKGADGYLVLRGESHSGPDQNGSSQSGLKPVAAIEQASYIDSRVHPGKTYCYAVRAYNEQGQSAATSAAGVTLPITEHAPEPEPVPEPEASHAFAGKRLRVQKKPRRGEAFREEEPSGTYFAAPEAPAELHAAIRGTRLVELQWQENASEGTEYRLYRSATPWCSYGLIAETKDCRFLDAVPEAGTKYYYFAQAVREGCSSGASAMAEALTFPGLPSPEPPERLRAAPVGPDAVELRWPHARGAAAYVIYARMEGGDFQVIGHTLDGGYLHENLPPDASVDYRVQSYHDTGVSEPSGTVTVRTGAARQQGARQVRPAPMPQNRRFPAFSLQGLQNPLIK